MPGNKNSGNRSGLPRAKGAGRPPKNRREHWLSGDAGGRGLSLVEAPADVGSPQRSPKVRQAPIGAASAVVAAIGAAGEVPESLVPAERGFWERWAPLATAIGTLTDTTRPGFVVLCQTAADAAELRAEIRASSITSSLWGPYRGLMARLEQLLARYGLASMGRAADAEEPKENDERAELRRLMSVK